jgi:tRNA(adenine34) deaminase
MTAHEKWMIYALKEAEKAYGKNEIPVGCIIVFKNKIIAKAHNQVETLTDPTAHSEILAITSAAENLQSKVLSGCTMYVTLEPCAMCAGAIVLAKIPSLYFGAYDNRSGCCGSVLNITSNKNLNHKVTAYGGILDDECGEILKSFLREKRKS